MSPAPPCAIVMVFTLCAPADLAWRLQVQINDDDAAALAACEAATAVIQAYCRQRFELVTDDVLTLDATLAASLLLPECPVIAVSAVSENGIALVLGTDYLWPSGPSFDHWRGGRLIRTFQFDAGAPLSPGYWGGTSSAGWSATPGWASIPQSIMVTYTHGYAPGSLPLDLVAVAADVAIRRFTSGLRSRVSGPAAAMSSYATSSINPGDAQGAAGPASTPILWPSEKERLSPYRAVGVG